MWSVTRRPRVLNLVSAVSVATFGAMCRHERVQVKIGGLRRTSGAMELRAHAMRPRHSMTANVETKILPNAQLAQLPGRVCSAMPSSGDGTAQPASSFRLEPDKHIRPAAGVVDEVHRP